MTFSRPPFLSSHITPELARPFGVAELGVRLIYKMRPQDFAFRLVAASFQATHFAISMVTDPLKYEFRYSAVLNASHDENRQLDEIIFSNDDGVIHEDLSADEIVQLLCRDLRVPQWIDIAVGYSQKDYTHLSLICCGRFHEDPSRLYYYEAGTQPFGIKSPVLPYPHDQTRNFNLPDRVEFFHKLRKFYTRA